MIDVFISYAREDRQAVAAMAKVMTERGWSVWWDEHLTAGPRFDDEIEKAIDTARVVVAVWSRTSVASHWVKNEATAAQDRGVLLPVILEEVRLPLAFRRLQHIDLTRWCRHAEDPPLQELMGAIEGRLSSSDGDVFIGRAVEFEALTAAVDEASRGSGRLCLISGEPGIGKTRLLQEVEAAVQGRQANVHWAFSYEDAGVPPYFTWSNVLRECLSSMDDGIRRALLSRWGGEIARLLPEFGNSENPRRISLSSEATDQARMQLFVAVSQILFAAADEYPLLLLFDNAHLFDQASLRLLEFIVPQLAGHPIALVLTYRDTDVDRKHPLFYSLAKFSQQPRALRLGLEGLSDDEVALLCQRTCPDELHPGITAHIQERSEGNPLYVTELLRIGSRRLALQDRVPDRIREVIAERLRRLSHNVDEALGIAAVVGRSFTVQDMQSVLKLPGPEPVLEAMDEAIRAGLVDRIRGSANSYRFRHELIRQCLYEEHGTARRVALHRDIATHLLEHGDSAHDDHHVSLLAHHFYEAGLSGDLKRAIQFCLLAGRRAAAKFAFAEAADQFRRAIELMDLDLETSSAERAEALLEQGEAEHAAGNNAAARRLLLSANIKAARAGAWETLAKAVIRFWEVGTNSGNPHRVCLPLHELALANLDGSALAMRARLLASYASALVFVARYQDVQRVADESLSIVRKLDDFTATSEVLKNLGWTFEHFETRRSLAIMKERYSLACARGDTLERLDSLFAIFWASAWLGELKSIRSSMNELQRLAADVSHVHFLYVSHGVRTALALLEGRWRAAVKSAREQYLIGRESGAMGVNGTYATQMFTLHWMRGRLADVRPLLRGVQGDEDATWQPGYALICAELDLRDDAKVAFDKAAADDFVSLPTLSDRSVALVYLIEVCVYLKDRERAAVLLDLFRRFEHQNIGFVHSVLMGSGARYAAKLELLLGRRDRARSLFRSALEMNRRMGAAPWLAWTQFEYATALLQSKRVDQTKVLELLDSAASTAKQLDMTKLMHEIEAIREPLRAGAERLSNREAQVLELAAKGASNQEIADCLYLSPATVATHMRNILRKTDAANRVEAIAAARRAGWIRASS